ncbi:MAG: serine hydrolase [Caldilineaceae bacterium]|nr:serine hydrolase [Caldilineaceae bacterium]
MHEVHDQTSIESDIQSVIAAVDAEISLFAHHIESGAEIDIAGDRVYPLASVLKVPVLVEAFRQIGEGRFALDDRFALTVAEKNLPSGVLTFFDDGLQPTLRDLLTLMIIISDNTATDMVMHRLGVGSINRTMRSLGLTEIHVPITIRQIFDDMLLSADPTQDLLELDKQPRKLDGLAFSLGPDNNTGTPRALTRLFTMIYKAEVLDRAACDAMLAILRKQQLNDRLPRYLPPGTPCLHKTGTLGPVRNDSGIIYVNDASHVAVTIFSRSTADIPEDDLIAKREHTTAVDAAFGRIGLLLYDYFQ